MYLIIDLGNTFAKIALFDTTTKALYIKGVLPKQFDNKQFEEILQQAHTITGVIVSSVVHLPWLLEQQLHSWQQQHIRCIVLSHQTPIPIGNAYGTPHTLGIDRLAAAVGAYTLYPDNNVLIIDAGTAITIDLLDTQKGFAGGNISPGIGLRFKSLHTFTDKLPLLERTDAFDFMGTNTHSAIVAGVQNSVLLEIDGYIVRYKQQYPNLTTVVTGGDGEFIARHLQHEVSYQPDLLFRGLLAILEYNL